MITRFLSPDGEGGGTGLLGSDAVKAGAGASGSSAGSAAAAASTEGAKPAASDGPWFKGWLKEDGTLDKSRLDHLPDTLKGFRPTLEQFNKFEDFLGSAAHNKSLVGKKGMLPLSENASEAERKEFDTRLREALRVPKTPEDYGIKRPDNFPEAMWDDGFAGEMGKVMHKHALSPEAARELVEANNRIIMERATKAEAVEAEAVLTARKAGNELLDREFGFQRAEMEKLAVRQARYMGIDPANPAFNASPEMIVAFARMGSRNKEPEFVRGESTQAPDAEAELHAIGHDKTHRYHKALRDPTHPLYSEANAHFDKLIAESMRKKKS